ncbi:MAG: hypothetical protein V2A78_02640 [bacterium]
MPNAPMFTNPISQHVAVFVIFFFALTFIFVWVYTRINRSILSVYLSISFIIWAFFMAVFLREHDVPLTGGIFLVFPVIGLYLVSATAALTAILAEKLHQWKVEDSFIYAGDRDKINRNFTMGLAVVLLIATSIFYKLPFILFNSWMGTRIPFAGGFLANLLLLALAVLAGYLVPKIIPWELQKEEILSGSSEKKLTPFLSVRGDASKFELVLIVISFLFSMSMVVLATKARKEAADYVGFLLFAIIAALYIRKEILSDALPDKTQAQKDPE